MIQEVAKSFTTETTMAVVAGFGFASAIAWMDLVRWLISTVVNVKQNGGSYYLLTALFTTLLAVIAIMAIQRAFGPVKRSAPVYAVTK